MLLHLCYLPSPFSIKTLDSTRTLLYFPSPSLSPQTPNKSSKSFIRCCSSSIKRTEIASKTAIQRIAEKLRSLGYIEEENSKQNQESLTNHHGSAGEIFLPSTKELPKQRVGYTIDDSWSTPENPIPKPGSGTTITNFHELKREVDKKTRLEKKNKKEERVPTLAELTLSPAELRRLTGVGIALKKKLKVGKAGITEGIVNGIHERWRRSEVVKIQCEDLCRMNMKRTQDILERKTGGVVVWRAGSNIILYRGATYEYPYFLTDNIPNDTSHDEPDVSPDNGVDGGKEHTLLCTDSLKTSLPSPINRIASTALVHGVGSPNRVRFQLPGEAELAEEADLLLDGLGPRFTDWWGYDPLPIDADLLPSFVPGFRRLFRLLPYGIRPKLTNDEMTTLRRLSRPLPNHFALGRNRRLQGVAAAIIKLWEKCEIAKIAVKRGAQNTNSVMMAEELTQLTGGTLISRDKEFIAIYRGKDFLPPAVSTAIAKRRNPSIFRDEGGTDQSPSVERNPELELRTKEPIPAIELQQTNGQNKSGSVIKQRKLKSTNSVIEFLSTKLSVILEKKEKAEKLLAQLKKAEDVKTAEVDREGITEEERYMLKKVGLRQKAFLLLGRRGVFAGTIENMHLHWKYRELVRIILSAKCMEDAHCVAKTLEAESGGILVAVEKVSKGFAIIVYRGKNYRRPADLRPRSLLTKRQAMKRSLEAQRRESLKLNVLRLNDSIDRLKRRLVKEDMETNHEKSTEYSRKITKLETKGPLGTDDYSQNQWKSRSVESANSEAAPGGYDSDSTSLHSDDKVEATDLDKLMMWSSQYNESGENEMESSFEPITKETQSTSFHTEVGDESQDESALCSESSLSQSGEACALVDAADIHVTDHESMRSSIQLGISELNSVHREKVKEDLDMNHEKSTEHSKKITKTKDHLGTVDYSQNQRKARSGESAHSQVALEGYGSESISLHSDGNEEAAHLVKLMTWPSQYNESAKTEMESSSELVMSETQPNSYEIDGDGSQDGSAFYSENSLSQGGAACSLINTADIHATDHRSMGSSIQLGNNELNSGPEEKVKKDFHEASFRAQPLSNRDRLILRKQALKMKRRPVLAIGRSNVVTGVAKAIKTHFKKHPLAIVNVKGRAKGTSVQELVFKLEQITGAVMVSQEPSKVILYRGWGEEKVPQGVQNNERNTRMSGHSIRGSRNAVSPELMAAIRLECGLSSSKEEERT